MSNHTLVVVITAKNAGPHTDDDVAVQHATVHEIVDTVMDQIRVLPWVLGVDVR